MLVMASRALTCVACTLPLNPRSRGDYGHRFGNIPAPWSLSEQRAAGLLRREHGITRQLMLPRHLMLPPRSIHRNSRRVDRACQVYEHRHAVLGELIDHERALIAIPRPVDRDHLANIGRTDEDLARGIP